MQRGVVTAATAGELSLDKIQTLSEYMSGLKDQVALLIDSTSFDRKKVLNGDATRISVQIGLKDLDRLELRISNLGSDKLFRVGVSNLLNNYLGAEVGRTNAYTNKTDLDNAVIDKVNFTQDPLLTDQQLANAIVATREGAESYNLLERVRDELTPQFSTFLRVEYAAAIASLIERGSVTTAGLTNGLVFPNPAYLAAQAAAQEAGNAATTGFLNGNSIDNIADAVHDAAENTSAGTGVNARALFLEIANNHISTLLLNHLDINGNNHGAIAAEVLRGIEEEKSLDEILAMGNAAANVPGVEVQNAIRMTLRTFGGGATIKTANKFGLESTFINSPGNAKQELLALFADNQAVDLSTEPGQLIAQDMYYAMLDVVRKEQATVSRQSKSVLGSQDALRAATNITEKAADSYTNTDYVKTAQEYSELIRQIVATITALQAGNKIPKSTQRLLESLV